MKMLGIGLCGDCACSATGSNADRPIDNQIEFTYDEGQGVKDTVVMDGPLSSVYANALNIYFAKKPLESSDQDSLSQAFESMAIDAMLSTAVVKAQEEADEETRKMMAGVKIVSANMDVVESPSAVIYTTSAKRELIDSQIDVIEASHERVKNAGKDFVVFVGPALGVDNEVDNIYDFIDFSNVSKINAFNISDKFGRATESFFETRGIPVVVGFENLFQWLKGRNKEK